LKRAEGTRDFITGAGGFVGLHLARYLLARGHRVFGFDIAVPRASSVKLQGMTWYGGDVTDQKAIERMLGKAEPDRIFHLAGIQKSGDFRKFYEVNLQGTIDLFEAVVKRGLAPRILVAGSSAVYGSSAGSRPLTEGSELRSMTHYGLSKTAQEMAAFQYLRVHNMAVACARTFNLIGPGQSPEMACSGFARQIARAERSPAADTIVTGDLRPKRDFVDVRDAVRAYDVILRSNPRGDIYNVCSGKAVAVQRCLEILIGMARVPLKTVQAGRDAKNYDVPIQVGSSAKLRNTTGWTPKIPLEKSLSDMLDYWRQRTESEPRAKT